LRRAALLFDCDGVLADTERDGHRVTFNAAFRQKGLSCEWSVEEYGELLKIGGGKERMTKCVARRQAGACGLRCGLSLRRAANALALTRARFASAQILQRPRRRGALQVAARRGRARRLRGGAAQAEDGSVCGAG
jgi:beta-phosphoglucomutase-like phosphatase (HAD superfamily)